MAFRVLVACDKFKDALTAQRATSIIARELHRLHPEWQLDVAPITDGGDGFAALLTEAARGEWVRVPASGPRLERLEVPVGFVDRARVSAAARNQLPGADGAAGPIAVIEMAAVNGLAQVPLEARDPWRTTSYGTGQVIRAAAELGARAILLGVGGSATSDLGLGALSALGFEFRDRTGGKVRPPFPAGWEQIAAIEGSLFTSIPPIAIACDVRNPLLGPDGAAAVYGPQKGLRATDLARHEAAAERLGRVLASHCHQDAETMMNAPGAGAAGGIAFGLMTGARAMLVPGFALVSAWLELDARLAAADLVITGEGRFDASSAAGKGPGEIVQRARAAGRRVVVFAGQVDHDAATRPDAAEGKFITITPAGTPLPVALSRAEEFLAQAVARCFS